MAAVQDRAHDGNGLTGDPRRGACSGRKRRARSPYRVGQALQPAFLDDTTASKDALNDHRMRKEAT